MFIELSQRQWIDRYVILPLNLVLGLGIGCFGGHASCRFPIALRYRAQTVESSMSPSPDLVVKALDEADYAIMLTQPSILEWLLGRFPETEVGSDGTGRTAVLGVARCSSPTRRLDRASRGSTLRLCPGSRPARTD
jgi:hypothetical protein